MSVIEDVRKVFQDLVAPELKSLSVKLDGFEREMKVRDETTQAKLDGFEREMRVRDETTQAKLDGLNARIDSGERLTHAKLEAVSAKMDAQYASIMNALDLDKRVGLLERDKQSASA